MVVWGIIFIYTGMSDLLVAYRTMDVSAKIRERKFKDIFIDKENTKEETKEEKKDSKSNKK